MLYGYKIFNHFHNSTTLKQIIRVENRLRHYWKNMDCIDLNPPDSVKNITKLDRSKFRKTIMVPKLKFPERNANKILPLLKKHLLKMQQFKPVQSLEDKLEDSTTLSNNSTNCMKVAILHPLSVKSWNCLPINELESYDVNENHFYHENLELQYENWRADELLKFILPNDQETLASYSIIGHIVHVNLRDHLLQYKEVIGEILKDKIPGCRSVVNKLTNINSTFRNFQLELICGDPDYLVKVKENGLIFEFDFSKVYWNPRLSTEHERIVNILNPSDVLYDVFAGVGPFTIPAAKKKCYVLANDLNPESFKFLNKNILHNKCTNYVKTFNKDGRDFILHDIRDDLLQRLTSLQENNYKIHITMNLPAIAVEFLDAFNGLLGSISNLENVNNFPIVHVYSFAKGENTSEIVKDLVEDNLKMKLDENLIGIYFVRNVAPNKDMYRVSFNLTKEILCNNSNRKRPSNVENLELNAKKIC